MSNIVKWAAVSDEETFAKVRVEFSFGDGSAVQKTVTMADFIRAMSTIEAEQEPTVFIILLHSYAFRFIG